MSHFGVFVVTRVSLLIILGTLRKHDAGGKENVS